MRRISVSAIRLATAVLLLASIDCKGDQTGPAIATTLTANSATTLTGVAGSVVTPAPSVIVKDQRGNPMSGVTVTFVVASGGGSVSGEAAVTDVSGTATVGAWTLGKSTGANVLSATAGTLATVSFTATATAGPAASLAKNAGDNQTATVATAVPVAPSVLVKDANGNPKADVSVTFTISSGGGSITGGTALTNASGIATVGSWTLGPLVGSNVLTATTGSLTAVSFTATSTAGAAASLVKNAGDNQVAAAGSAVAIPPSVIVKDANGNPKSGVPVTFAVTSGGGSVTGATVSTNSAGVAAVGSWTLGSVAGANALAASSPNLPTVSFSATAAAGVAASLTRNGGDGQTATVATAVATPPSVIVKDANGNPAPGLAVTFSVVSGGGSVTGASAVTNNSGIATVGSWVLGRASGANVLSASSGNLSVLFSATAIAGPVASIVKNGGDNQAAVVGVAVPNPPSVIVTDAYGNPETGITVTFAVVSGGGSVTGSAPVTNTAGVASVGSWILGGATGANSLSATVAGLAPVTFNATAISAVCASRLTHVLGTVSNGSLTTSSCQLPDGSFVDFYATSIPQAGAYMFREGAVFDAYLLLAAQDGTTIAENDDELDTGTNAGIKALLPAGNYVLGAGTFSPNVTGDYTISSSAVTTDVANCEHVFVVKNISTTQNITTSDCNLAGPGGTPIYADGYLIFIPAGTTVTITMSSSVLDSFLQLVQLDGTLVTQNDNIDSSTTNARITFTSTQSSYYAIFARSVPTTSTGSYTLTIQ